MENTLNPYEKGVVQLIAQLKKQAEQMKTIEKDIQELEGQLSSLIPPKESEQEYYEHIHELRDCQIGILASYILLANKIEKYSPQEAYSFRKQYLKERPPDGEISKWAVAYAITDRVSKKNSSNSKNSETISIQKVQDIVDSVSVKYSNMLQGNLTNALAHTSKRNFTFNPMTEEGIAETGEVIITTKKYHDLTLNVPAHKVLDILTTKLTRNFPYGTEVTLESLVKHRSVKISVNEYMKLCNLTDRAGARKQLKEAILDLYNISLECDEERYHMPKGRKRGKTETIHWKARILDSTIEDISKDPVKQGNITANFTLEIVKYFSQAFIMPYPDKLLHINANDNRHSYYIGRKLVEHHNMNIGKENANRISVKTLLTALPDLPSYENTKHVTQQIINPFDRDLMALQDKYNILASWHYCNSGGEPLTDEQVESYRYDNWIQWLIEFELADYPDQSERLAEKKRKRLPAKRKKTTGDN